jgi:hypothetical protein
MASNYHLFGQGEHKDDDFVIQLVEDMEIGEHELVHNAIVLEEVASHYTYH